MGGVVDARVEIAFGASVDSDPVVWQFTDVTDDLMPDPISITRGRQDEAAHDASSSCRFTLDNRSSAYTPNHPASPWYPDVSLGTPVRVTVSAEHTFLTALRTGAAQTTDPVASRITGSIDVRFEAVTDNWAGITLAGKWGNTDGSHSWLLSTTQDEQLVFTWSPDGTTPLSFPSGVPMPPRRHRAVRATLVADDGAGGLSVTLYTADSLTGPWTVLGVPAAAPITTSIFASAEPVRVGWFPDGPISTLDEVLRVEVRRSATGPLVAAPDFTRPAPGATTFTDETGRAWAISGIGAVITDRRVRFSGFVVEWAPDWPHGDLSTSDGYPGESGMSVTAAGVLRRLDQNRLTPPSTMRAEWLSPARAAALTYWPCEEPNGSATFAPVGDGAAMTIAGDVTEGAITDVVSAVAMPAFGAGQASAMFPRYPDGGVFHAAFLLRLPKNGVKAADTPLITFYGLGQGTAVYYSVEARPDGVLAMRSRSALGGTLETTVFPATPFPLNGVTQLARFSVTRSDSTTSAGLTFFNEQFPSGYSLTKGFNSVFNPPQGIVIGGGWFVGQSDGFADLNGSGIGHVFCDYVASDIDGQLLNASRAWTGERAGDRLRRLCFENSIPLALTGSIVDTEKLATQRPSLSLPDLLRECATVDGGILYERRTLPGVAYRTRASLYTQPPAMILDAGSGPGDIRPGFAPVLDDRNVHNDVTVTRTKGGVLRATDTDHIAGHSRYDTQLDVNVASETQLPDIAWWQVHLGTEPGMRYPQISPNMAANPALLRPWLDADIGDRIEVTGLPPQHPPGTVGLLMQGYTETLRPYRIDADVNASPGRPWQVATTAPTAPDGGPWRADTVSSQITTALSTTDQTFAVRTNQGPQWIATATHPTQFPFLIQINGETMRVTAITGTASPQTFMVVRGVDGLTRLHALGSLVTVASRSPAAR